MIPATTPQSGRGRYDRTKSPVERAAHHAHRLALATAAAVAQHGIVGTTVDRIVRVAGVGRNTFYRHYRDLDHAIRHARAAASESLWKEASAGLAAAYTPTEKIRAIVHAWIKLAQTDPNTTAVLLHPRATDQPSAPSEASTALSQLLTAALADAHRDALLSAPPEQLRVLAATGALEAVARACLWHPGSTNAAESTLVDIVVRLFR